MPVLPFNPLILVALLAGAWLAVALWATWRGRRLAAAAQEVLDDHTRLAALLGAGPATPLLIARDGSLFGQDRLAGAFGLELLPARWSEFTASAALDPGQAGELDRCVVEAASGSGFAMTLRPTNSAKVFRVEGGAAPPAFAERTVLLWFVDISEAEEQAGALRARLERRSAALEALSRLLELAPFPMWHRGPDLALAMVNSAYVAAVEAADAAVVVAEGIELIEEAGGQSPRIASAEVRDRQEPAIRTVPRATTCPGRS
jgi:PAS domain-containing protein